MQNITKPLIEFDIDVVRNEVAWMETNKSNDIYVVYYSFYVPYTLVIHFVGLSHSNVDYRRFQPLEGFHYSKHFFDKNSALQYANRDTEIQTNWLTKLINYKDKFMFTLLDWLGCGVDVRSIKRNR